MADFTPPQNYAGTFANLPTPTQDLMQGVQAGAGIQQVGFQQQMQQAQFSRMQAMQRASMQVAQNPTPQNLAQLSIAFPEMSEQYKRSYDMLTPAQQQQRVNFASQVYAAANNGRPDLAAQMLNDRATALENSGGDPQEIQQTRTMAQWAEQHPDSFKMSTGMMLSAAMGPDKFAQTYTDLAKTPAEVENIESQVQQRANQFSLDKDKLQSETQLKLRELELQYGTPPDDTRKLINDSAIGAASGEQSAARLDDLASRLDGVSRAPGFAGTAADAWKKVTGSEDGVSALKQEYARIVNNQALGSIKEALGGRVTDVDMKTAMGSVPDPNASPTLIAAYLRGTSKLQRIDAAMQEARAEWLSQAGRQGHLGLSKQDMTVMGTKVPAGTTFADFSRQFIQQKAEQIAAQAAVVRGAGRSYMRFAQPQPDQTQQPPQSSGIEPAPGAQ